MKKALIAGIAVFGVFLILMVVGLILLTQRTVDDPKLYLNWKQDIAFQEQEDGTFSATLNTASGTAVAVTVCSEELTEQMNSQRLFWISLDYKGRVCRVRSAEDEGYTWAAVDHYMMDYREGLLTVTADQLGQEEYKAFPLNAQGFLAYHVDEDSSYGDFARHDQVSVLTRDGAVTHMFISDRMYGKVDFCQGCKKEVAWSQWRQSGALPKDTGHYYLIHNLQVDDQVDLAEGQNICLNLSGYTVRQTAAGKSFYSLNGCSFNLMDYGNPNGDDRIGCMYVGAVDGDAAGCFTVGQNASLRIFGGLIDAGSSKGAGGLCVDNPAGSVTLYGGTLRGGVALGDGGGAVRNAGSFTVLGGEIRSGMASNEAGNSRGGGSVFNTGLFIMTGGTVTGGISETVGGCVYNAGEMILTGGMVQSGRAPAGGNVYSNLEGSLHLGAGMELAEVYVETPPVWEEPEAPETPEDSQN